MNQISNRKPNQWILCIFFLQVAANIFILLDVPVARQIVGFTYFTFVPGYVLIRLFKMKMKGLIETFLFSVGLSIAFLMLIGLIINEFHSIFAVQKPLSLIFLLPAINSFTVICTIIEYLRNRNGDNEPINLNVENPLTILILLCIPTLSIIGAITSGIYGDNIILLFTLMAVAAIFVVTIISKRAIPTKLYLFIVLIIAISLIYHSALISEKIITFGSDLTGEVFAQKIIEKNAYWNPANPYPGDQSVGRTYSMLSVTILPSIYHVLLNLDSTLIFKLFYALFLALVPLGLYNFWKNFLGEKYAFISAFFFISFQPFYTELLGLNKQILGELFLVLLLTAILNGKKSALQRTICIIIFSFGLIVSHYALAEIFLFFSLFVLILSIITRKLSTKITASFILTFFAIMFAWYLFTSSSAVYESFTTFGGHVYNELGDFFNPQSREPEILRGLGLEEPPTVWNLVSRVFAYVTEALIILGFISIILKRSKIYSDKDYFFLVFGSMLFLGALIAVPGLAGTMNTTRFYHILLFFLAPLCVLGAETIANSISKTNIELKAAILLLIVLVPYFLFQTNFIYEVTRSDSWSVSLSSYRMSALRLFQLGYTDVYGVFGPRWLSSNVGVGCMPIYCDPFGWSDLRGYGLIYLGYVESLSKTTQVATDGVIYLSSLSVIKGTEVALQSSWNTSELQFLHDLSKIYSNGGSEIYCKNE